VTTPYSSVGGVTRRRIYDSAYTQVNSDAVRIDAFIVEPYDIIGIVALQLVSFKRQYV